MKVGDLVEYIDDSEMQYKYSKFIGQLALVEIETQENVRVLWLKKNYCGLALKTKRFRKNILKMLPAKNVS